MLSSPYRKFTLTIILGPTELPPTNLKLAYVVIGRGVQNYTCTKSGAIPSAIGAVATLFGMSTCSSYRRAQV